MSITENNKMEAKVNEKSYIIDILEGAVTVDGDKKKVDIAKINDNTISLISEGKQTMAQIVSLDSENKTVVLLIDQTQYEVNIKDKMDLLLDELGMADMLTKKMADLTSPMPGLIVKVEVASGDTVQKGDPLIILEAMKMENSLKASADGVVADVQVEAGSSVEKGQTLITFE